MLSSLPSSETPALGPNSRFLGKGFWLHLKQGFITEAKGMTFPCVKQFPGRHSEMGHTPKCIAICNMKLLVTLITLYALDSKTSDVVKSISY